MAGKAVDIISMLATTRLGVICNSFVFSGDGSSQWLPQWFLIVFLAASVTFSKASTSTSATFTGVALRVFLPWVLVSSSSLESVPQRLYPHEKEFLVVPSFFPFAFSRASLAKFTLRSSKSFLIRMQLSLFLFLHFSLFRFFILLRKNVIWKITVRRHERGCSRLWPLSTAVRNSYVCSYSI